MEGKRKAGWQPGHKLSVPATPEQQAHKLRAFTLAWKMKALRKQGIKYMPTRVKNKIGILAAKRHADARREKKASNARDIQRIAMEASAQAMRVAAEVMNDANAKPSDRLSAVEMILNRAVGRPTQTNINASLDANAAPHEATGKELDQRIAETIQRVEELAGGTAKKAPREKRSINIRVGDRDPGSTNVH